MAANEGQAKGKSDFNPLSNPNVMDFGIDEGYATAGAIGGATFGGLPGAIIGGIGLPIAARTVGEGLHQVQENYREATRVPERRMDTITKTYPDMPNAEVFKRAMQGPVTESERSAVERQRRANLNPFDITKLGNY